MNDADYIDIWLERFGGWTLITIFCAIPVLYMLFIPEFWGVGWYGIASGIGKITGVVGFILYAINMLLSVRRRWLERFFNGLNRVYIAHHLTGGIALILLAFHPVFLAVRYIELSSLATLKLAAQSLLPRAITFDENFRIVQQQVAVNNGFIAFTGMVTLLILTFFIKLPYRVWLFTHKFLGPAFFFASMHVLFISSDVSRSPFLKIYMIIWAIIGLGAFTYRTLFGNIFVRRYPFQVSKVEKLPKGVMSIELKAVEDRMPFKAGQFVFVRFLWQKHKGILPEVHPFSIASNPSDGVLRLVVKSLGDHTKSMLELPIGTIAEVEGAFGKFNYQRFANAEQIWVAGGIGVTPFLSMASTLDKNSPAITLFYSVVAKDELIGDKVFASINPAKTDTFKYVPFVTDETKKFIDAEFLEKNSGNLKGKEIFLCGPPSMMKSLRKQLKAKGVKSINIHSEEFTMS